MPLLFAYTPLIGGDFFSVMRIGVFSLFGIYAVNCLVQRYAEGPLRLWHYLLIIIGGMLSFIPLNWAANLIGAILIVALVWLSKSNGQRI